MRRVTGLLLLVFMLGIHAQISRADVRLPALIGNNMVLQRNQSVPIWGWAAPGENVIVRFAGTTSKATADQTGRWRVTVPNLEADSEPRSMYVEGSSGSRIELTGILVGEVWFCTGPSNIYWPVEKCDNADEEIRQANLPRIRFFTVERSTADEPQSDCVGNWFHCSSNTVGEVSGIGYFFGRRLHQDLDIPIGLIQSFWGGSRIEAWTSREALDAEPAVKPILRWWQEEFKHFNPAVAQAQYERQIEAWGQAVAQAKSNDSQPPRRPAAPQASERVSAQAGLPVQRYECALIPFSIRGVICYQGLGNLFWADYNAVLLETMLRDWRTRWAQGDFPVGMVQPAPYDCSTWSKPGPDAYSVQREAQLIVQKRVSNTGIATTMDIDAVDVLHFTNKQIVGRRLAHWALATVYGVDLSYAGPVYESMTMDGELVRLLFRDTGTGLTTSDGRPPRHFEIAGANGEYYPAEAQNDGSMVVVRSEHVAKPTAVRFAFNDTAVVNLTNNDGLPVSLFRTDAVGLIQASGDR